MVCKQLLQFLSRLRYLSTSLRAGKKSLVKLTGTVRSTNGDWNNISFQAFDLPLLKTVPYSERLEILQSLEENSNFRVVPITACNGRTHLMKNLTSLIYNGGEGIMLRDPSSMYESGRSSSVLKVKVRHN